MPDSVLVTKEATVAHHRHLPPAPRFIIFREMMMTERDTCREQPKRLRTGIRGKLSLYVWAKESFLVERTPRLGEGTG